MSRHPKPIYRITLDGRDITPTVQPRLGSLTLTDNRGFEADQVEIVLDDADGQLAIPARGVTLSVAIGWEATGLVDKGSYIVDEVEHSGAPDQLRIGAKSADLRTGLTTKKEKSWAGHTIAEIVKSIAKAHGVTPKVSAKLGGRKIEHIDQTGESDANLLTRLARDHDAIATVKKGMLLFMPIGEARSVSGVEFPTATITRQSGDRHRFAMAERDTYTGVKACFQNVRKAATGEVLVDAKGTHTSKKSGRNVVAASADNTKTLRHTYATRNNAERAAKAEWQRLQRGLATFSLTLALGRPDLFPDLPVSVQGFKREIDAADWLIARAVHTLTDSGLTTALEMELKRSAEPDETETEDVSEQAV